MVRYSPKYKRFYNDSFYYSDPRHSYKPSRRNAFTYNNRKAVADPLGVLARKVKYIQGFNRAMERGSHSDKYRICETGFTRGQGWGGIFKAWQGFIINMNKTGDVEKIETYARAIQRMEKDLGVAVNQFPELKLAALDYMQDSNHRDVLEEKARKLNKDVSELNSQDILSVMIEEDKKSYEQIIKAQKSP